MTPEQRIEKALMFIEIHDWRRGMIANGAIIQLKKILKGENHGPDRKGSGENPGDSEGRNNNDSEDSST
jgi:hypothetical protein